MGTKVVRRQDGSAVVVGTGHGARGILTNLGSDAARKGPRHTPARPASAPFAEMPTPDAPLDVVWEKYQASAPEPPAETAGIREDDIPTDTGADLCPDCGEGEVVLGRIDGRTGVQGATCSEFCGWSN